MTCWSLCFGSRHDRLTPGLTQEAHVGLHLPSALLRRAEYFLLTLLLCCFCLAFFVSRQIFAIEYTYDDRSNCKCAAYADLYAQLTLTPTLLIKKKQIMWMPDKNGWLRLRVLLKVTALCGKCVHLSRHCCVFLLPDTDILHCTLRRYLGTPRAVPQNTRHIALRHQTADAKRSFRITEDVRWTY